MDLDKILALAKDAAFKAGKLITDSRRSQDFTINYKKGFDPVTSADLKAEKLIVSTIRARFPDHAFLAEESYSEPDEEMFKQPLWIIDPIDGTTNYTLGHNQVAVSIAFAVNGEVLVGVVHAPFQNETFYAVKGKGAKLNDTVIKVRSGVEFSACMIGMGAPSSTDNLKEFIKKYAAVFEHCHDLRRIGSGALDICWVGAGRYDGFYETLKAWDMAAACLIAREGGARTGHLNPQPPDSKIPPDLYSRELVVAAPGIYDRFCELMRGRN